MLKSVCKLVALLLLALPGVAHAVDAVSGASRPTQATNTPNAAIWIVGRGFVAGTTVTISGNGIAALPGREPLIIQEEERIDGGRGDGIAYYFSISADADLGPRNITLTAPDGRSVTGMALIEIVAGADPEPDPGEPEPGPGPEPGEPEPGPGGEPEPGPPPPPAQDGVVTEITRASPRAGEVGAQVNVWIAGQSFSPGLDVKWSDPALGPASFRGAPLAYGIVRNAESERGELDGIQYYLRIGAEANLGPVDITVTGADGSRAEGRGLFEVVAEGEAPAPLPGDGDIQAVTGASPAAVRSGRNVAIWMWGLGIAEGATISFGAGGVEEVAPAEVVEQAANNPGFAGVRNYLRIAADAAPGPVSVTITNPNGTTATNQQLFTIVPGAGGPVGGGAGGGGGDPGNPNVGSPGAVGDGTCPDNVTSIEGITEVKPAILGRGEVVNVAVIGRAFACGANVIIPGGGLTPLDEPRIVRDPADPLKTTLFWRLQVDADARVGTRDLTVINPNNTSKTLVGAFDVDGADANARRDEVAFCALQPGHDADPIGLLGLLAILGLAARRRRG